MIEACRAQDMAGRRAPRSHRPPQLAKEGERSRPGGLSQRVARPDRSIHRRTALHRTNRKTHDSLALPTMVGQAGNGRDLRAVHGARTRPASRCAPSNASTPPLTSPASTRPTNSSSTRRSASSAMRAWRCARWTRSLPRTWSRPGGGITSTATSPITDTPPRVRPRHELTHQKQQHDEPDQQQHQSRQE
jgi:hypothetical protein